MKKLLLYLMMIVAASSCVVPQSGMSVYQTKNVKKFSKKKNYRPNKGQSGPRYVPPRKRGNLRHPAVPKQVYKERRSIIKWQRMTSSN
jgi:hypothetical protein